MLRTRTSCLHVHDRLRSLSNARRTPPIFLAVFAMAPARADEPAKPASRTEATAIIAEARKIVTPNGVERLEKVRIGGIDQWVSIRGTDRSNPVLLLHPRRPGIRLDPDELVVLPAAGRSISRLSSGTSAPPARPISLPILPTIAPTLTRERMIADTEEMAAWAAPGSSARIRYSSSATAGAAFSACSSPSITPNGCTPILASAS